MDFQSMKRKQLQALCKKHGVSANLSNREMADRLSLILKKNKKVSERNSKVAPKVVKKVRFSPENETFVYKVSGYKRGGRRRTMKPLPKKRIRVIENEVVSPPPTGRKRARRGVKNDNVEVKSVVESDSTGGLVTRRLRTREVVVEKSGGVLVVSKNAEDEVSEDNAVAGKDVKPSGRITRFREGKASGSGVVQAQSDEIRKGKGPHERRVVSEILAADIAEQDKDGDSEMLAGNSRKVEVSRRSTRFQAKIVGKASEEQTVQLQEPSKGQGRYASRREPVAPKKRRVGSKPMNENGAEQDKLLQKTELNVIKDRGSEISIGNSMVVEVAKRSTRSQAKFAGKASKDLSKYASARKSVVPQKGKVESDELQDKKETGKRSRNTNSNLEVASKFEAVAKPSKETAKVETVSVTTSPLRRTRRNTVMFTSSDSTVGKLEPHKTVEETRKRARKSNTKLEATSRFEAIEESSKETEKVENVSVPTGPLRRTRHNTVMFTSSDSTVGELEPHKTVEETRKRTRKSNTKLEATSRFEAIEESSKETEKVENVSVPTGPLRRTRRNTVMFTSSDSTVGELEPHKTVEETRKRTRKSNTKLEATSRFEAIEESSKETEKVENVSVPTGPLRRTRRNTVMFTSSDSTVGELEPHKTVEETRKRTRKSNTKLEATSKFEAIVESSKEIEKVGNVSVSSGPSRRTRHNSTMITSSVLTDGELETHQTVQVEDACLSKAHQRRSSRNASRNNSIPTNTKLGRIANAMEKGKQRKQRREQIIDEEISTSKCKPLAENPPRRSPRVASKGDLVEPAAPAVKVVGKKRHSRSRMLLIVESPSESFSAPKEPLIEDARLTVGEAARTENNLDANYSKQVLESSNKKKKTYSGEFKAMKQLGSVLVSTVNSVMMEATNTTMNLEETSPANQSNKLNRKGDFGDVSLVELEVTEMNNKASNVISPEITSPGIGFSPANQSDNLTEPSNILVWEKAVEAEEPSTGKNTNHGSDIVDDQSSKDDRALAQEHQTLVQSEDAKQTAETTIQEALLKENRIELSERSSEKRFEIPLEKAEEIRVINPSDEQGSSHTENFLEAVEMREIAAESNLVIGVSSALRIAEMQLRTTGGNATEATPSRPALETEAMVGFDNEVNNVPVHTFIANNVDMKEEAYNAEAQNDYESTGVERGNTYSIGGEEYSGNGTEISDKILCIESSVSNAWDGLCSQTKTRDHVTINKNQPEEIIYNERTSQVLSEKITEDYNGNLLVDGSAIPDSVARNDGDAKKKENEVSELCTQDAVENENEVSEHNPINFFKENREKCMHEPLDAEEIDLIITEESGTDAVKDTSVVSVDLQSPSTSDREKCHELALLENKLINDEHGTGIGNINLSSSRARLSVHNDMQENLKAKLNEDAKYVLMAEVQREPLPQFALEKLQYNMETDTPDGSNISGKVFCQPIEDCNSGNRTEVQDSDLVVEKSCSIGIDVPLNECSLATKEINGKGFHGELGVEQCADVVKEENAECALKVVLDKNVHNLDIKDIDGKGFNGESDVEECADVVKDENADCVLEVELGDKNELEGTAPQVNDAAGASLGEIIVKESEFSDDKRDEIMIAPSECIERVDTALGALNEIISATCEDLEEKSMEVLGPVQHVDEVKFDNLKYYKEENVLELERICSVTSDSLMSRNDTDTNRKGNVEIMTGDLNFNFNSSDDVKEDNVNAFPQVCTNDIDDHLPEVEFHKVDDSDHNVLLDDAGEVSVVGDTDSENFEDGTKWVQKTPIFSQTIENRSEWSMKNSAKGKFFADSSFDKPEMSSNTAAVSHSMDISSLGITENKSLELHVDLPQLTSPDTNMILRMAEQVEVEKSAGSILEANLTQDDAPEVKENLTNDERFNQPVLEMTRDGEDSLEVKESVTTDEHVTEKQLGEQERQSHLTVSDKPIHDDEETNEQNGLSAINQECNYDIHNDSYVPTEKVMLKDAAPISSSNVDDSDMINVEYGSHDSKKADTVAVNPAVSAFSGSKGVAAYEVNIGGAKKMDMHEEVENGVTCPPIMPVELCADLGKPEETSPEIAAYEEVDIGGAKTSPETAGTFLQQIFSSSSGWEEKNISENRLFDAFSEYEFAASSTVSCLYDDITVSNEIQIKDFSNNAGGEMVDEDGGQSHRDVSLFFQEYNDSTLLGKSNAAESFSVENSTRNTQDVVKEQLGEDEGDKNDAICPDNIHCSALNQSPCDNKCKGVVLEADELRIDDGVVTAGDSKEIADLGNLNGASSLVPEMVVDCSAVSSVCDFSNSELKVEPDIFTAREINLFSGPGEQDEIENSDAGTSETCLISQDAGEVKENAVTVEQVAPQVAKFKSTLLSDFAEPMCEGGEGSKEQEHVLDMKHSTPDHTKSKNESLKLESIIDSAPVKDDTAKEACRLELNLVSPPKKSPDVNSVRDTWLAKKKTNSSMMMNSSVRKQSNNRSSVIQRTPKQLAHDMKENMLSSKRDFSSITAHKTASKRRALEDLRKN
ncbi:hypothetical protein Q3G72_016581 [Acer saccharum]|nr:hypothetical protein Q3G72_016581 [Acer saccharum]